MVARQERFPFLLAAYRDGPGKRLRHIILLEVLKSCLSQGTLFPHLPLMPASGLGQSGPQDANVIVLFVVKDPTRRLSLVNTMVRSILMRLASPGSVLTLFLTDRSGIYDREMSRMMH